jgi:uncharacterized LabA/DUF88 family protein
MVQPRPLRGAGVAVYGGHVKTYVYIDGFNFYYGAVKDSPYKWLDFKALASRLLPNDQIIKLKYFTAKVDPSPRDPAAPLRQEVYLRALRAHIPELETHFGYFLSKIKKRPLVSTGALVKIRDREEKGSDVNLAVHLVNDAWKGAYESALVISNDSDLVEAVRIVTRQLRLPVGVANPQMRKKKKMAVQLRKSASFRIKINVSDLAACQLPDPIPGTKISKPTVW